MPYIKDVFNSANEKLVSRLVPLPHPEEWSINASAFRSCLEPAERRVYKKALGDSPQPSDRIEVK